MSNLLELARTAAGQVQGDSNVGDFIESLPEPEPGTETYFFASKLKGYPDWRWAVTLFTDAESGQTTVSEVNLLPGDTSLQAPQWVPWSERLADYKALQAALEEQAKVDAEEAAAAAEAADATGDTDSSETDEDDDILDVEEEDEDSDSSASTLGDESEDSESDADDAGGEPKSFFRYKFLRRHKKRK